MSLLLYRGCPHSFSCNSVFPWSSEATPVFVPTRTVFSMQLVQRHRLLLAPPTLAYYPASIVTLSTSIEFLQQSQILMDCRASAPFTQIQEVFGNFFRFSFLHIRNRGTAHQSAIIDAYIVPTKSDQTINCDCDSCCTIYLLNQGLCFF